MGQIRDDFGRVSIESRRDGFIIHASYGRRPARTPANLLLPGDWFKRLGRDELLYVTTINTQAAFVAPDDHPAAKSSGSIPRDGTLVVKCDRDGVPLDSENDPHDPLGDFWSRYPHPEFANDDLGDLILALADFQGSLEAHA